MLDTGCWLLVAGCWSERIGDPDLSGMLDDLVTMNWHGICF
jgi:hypothetical protein